MLSTSFQFPPPFRCIYYYGGNQDDLLLPVNIALPLHRMKKSVGCTGELEGTVKGCSDSQMMNDGCLEQGSHAHEDKKCLQLDMCCR